MIDVTEVKKQAEAEVREEKMKAAKEKIKNLLKKEDLAKQVLINVQKEIADAYATIGEGSSL
jgi:hypothetical protein